MTKCCVVTCDKEAVHDVLAPHISDWRDVLFKYCDEHFKQYHPNWKEKGDRQ